MEVQIQEIVTVHPATPPFSDDHILPLSHLDTDRNLNVIFRYLRVYVNNESKDADPFDVVVSSLSAALVRWYQFAGTLRRRAGDNRLELHCLAGGGVRVARAKVDCALSTVNYLDDPDENFVEKLVPGPTIDEAMAHPFTLQITRFACGGWVMGTAVHHAMCDGMGATLFFNAMAEVARGEPFTVEPAWNRAGLLGPRNPPRIDFPVDQFLSLDKDSVPYAHSGKPAAREFFEMKDEWLDRLKATLHQQSGSNYTTFEALGAFIWRASVKASKIPENETVKFAYQTNIRRKVKPSLPFGYWGNGCVPMYVQLAAKDLTGQPLWKTAELINKSKFNTTDDYVRSFIDFQELHFQDGITPGNQVSGFTDWRHIGHATVDFGWGGPVTVFPLTRHLLGGVAPCYFLPYSAAGEGKKDGFKVLVYVQEEAMPAFKEEMEKLSGDELILS
nr:spermidine coumaroyl-CoA acyltransferase [Ipomoea batatas]